MRSTSGYSALMPMAISDSAVIKLNSVIYLFFLLHVKFINCAQVDAASNDGSEMANNSLKSMKTDLNAKIT